MKKKMDDRLIASVFKREPLWNPANGCHKNVVVLKKLWEEVAFELQKDVKILKARWKNLRAYFFKELEKSKSGDSADKTYTRTWQYYDQLLFLNSMKNESENSEKDSNLSADNDDNCSIKTEAMWLLEEPQNPGSVYTDSDSEIILPTTSHDQESQTYSQPSQRKKIRKNRPENNELLLEIEKKKLELLERESIKEKSDDLLFFESLLPYVENIPLRRKLRLRSKIQDLILDEMETVENNVQQPAPVIHVSVNTQQSVEYEMSTQKFSQSDNKQMTRDPSDPKREPSACTTTINPTKNPDLTL